MKLYTVDFEGVYPVGNCLIILAPNLKRAEEIAGETIKHTKAFTIQKVDMSKESVVLYMDGDY